MFIYIKEKCVWTSLGSWHIHAQKVVGIYILILGCDETVRWVLTFKRKPNDAFGRMQHYISFRFSFILYRGISKPRTRRKGYPRHTHTVHWQCYNSIPQVSNQRCLGTRWRWRNCCRSKTHALVPLRPPAAAVPRSLVHRSSRPSVTRGCCTENARRASPTRARYEIPRWRDLRHTRWRRPVLFDPATSNWEC